jgi:hypothetical protein
MSRLLFLLVATVALVDPALHAQGPTYIRGDIVRLVSSDAADPLPDSRILAVPGDRIRVDKTAVTVNGEAVSDVPPALLADFTEPFAQTIPAGHYFVIGEKRAGPNSVVQYHAVIPVAKIYGKVTKP